MRRRFASLCVAVGLLSAASAHAEPIQITSGFLNVPARQAGQILLEGDGFQFGGATLTGWNPAEVCTPCGPTGTITPNGTWVGSDLRGTATYNGVQHTNVGGLISTNSGTVSFQAEPIALPEWRLGETTVTSPFLFMGAFFLGDFPMRERVDLFGSGQMTLTLRGSQDSQLGRMFWGSTFVSFTFLGNQGPDDNMDPVPEPATMMLVGTALSGLAMRLRRRQRAIVEHR